MARLRLISWNADEARGRAALLRAAGHRVVHRPPRGPEDLKALRASPPEAVVIDLARLPMQGRDLALALRAIRATRDVPLVFVGGARDKLARVKETVPGAAFTTWGRVAAALERVLARPPKAPPRPASAMAGYSGTPLPKKLGIKPGSVVALVGAPADLARTLGALPEGARLRKGLRGAADLVLWFTKSRAELERRMKDVERALGTGGLWIAWPKKASGVVTDVSQDDVRRVGLAAGLVDFKICAIDATWSGLRFARRK